MGWDLVILGSSKGIQIWVDSLEALGALQY